MAITLVQSVIQSYAGSAGARTATLPSNLTAGNLVVVCYALYLTSNTTATIADSLGQTYTLVDRTNPTTGAGVGMFYVANCAAGACTVTLTPGATTRVGLVVLEYSGVATTPTVNSAKNSFGSGNASTGTITANAGDLIVASYNRVTNSDSPSVQSPFTMRQQATNGLSACVIVAADDQNAGGNESCSITTGASGGWAMVGASFSQASVAPTWLPSPRPTIFLPLGLEQPQRPRTNPTYLAETTPAVSAWQPPRKFIVPSPVLPAAVLPRPLSPVFLAPYVPPAASEWNPTRLPIPRPAAIFRDQPEIPRRDYPAGLIPTIPFPPDPTKRYKALDLIERSGSEKDIQRATDRLRRLIDKATTRLNSLVRRGEMFKISGTEWGLRSGGWAIGRAPLPLDDITVGVAVGQSWVDTTTNKIYFCVSNTAGAAVWVGPFG